jgi:hypothetical protein
MLSRPSLARTGRWGRRATLVLALVLALGASVLPGTVTHLNPTRLVNLNGHYPKGVPDPTEPSGEAPPGPNALVGYRQSYVTDFNGTSAPPGWDVFTGIPGGDPGGHFIFSHTIFANGILELLTSRDPAFHNRWVTGGICQCGVSRIYGAYFVRSRLSGPGPNEAELLWPKSNKWPPEIDFNETGGSDISTTTSLHFGAANTIVRSVIHIDMTQWHTWGVIWTPTLVLYTVDGRVWGRFTTRADIPRVPMNLDFEQRALCSLGRQCPTAPEQMDIDWVSEYARS